MNRNEYNFIGDKMNATEEQLFKKRLFQSIISTDMAQMNSLRKQLNEHMNALNNSDDQNSNKLIDTSSPSTTEDSKQLVCNAILHACDISTSLREYDLSVEWADLLFAEFFSQGDTEKSMKLEVSMMCDRETTNIASGQAGFIQFVVMPVF